MLESRSVEIESSFNRENDSQNESTLFVKTVSNPPHGVLLRNSFFYFTHTKRTILIAASIMSASSCLSSKSLGLYRSILREHKRRLPAKMKALGDTYVKQEFRLHKEAKPDHLKRFIQSWENYLMTLQTQSKGNIGTNINADDVSRMTEEQKQKMRGLMDSAIKK